MAGNAVQQIQAKRQGVLAKDPNSTQFAALLAVTRHGEREAIKALDQHCREHGCADENYPRTF
jgi:hypothetical protein